MADSYTDDLARYTLNNIEEMELNEPNRFRYGSDAEIIELNWNGTRCVGKKLHPIFFQEDSDPGGIQCLIKKFLKEIKLLSEIKHPNIVQFLGLYYQNSPPQKKSKRPVMVMEKMDYSLTEYLKAHPKGCIPQEKVISILSNVARGLIYLHVVQEIAHRDLSSNNILVSESLSTAKIADFGSARILDSRSQAKWTRELTAQPGTQDFMPPEALEDPPRYGLSVDVFSFGCVIIHLTTHKWPKPSGKSVNYTIILSEWDRRFKFISEMGTYGFLKPVVKQCLEDHDYLRPSSKEILSSLEDIFRGNREKCSMPELLRANVGYPGSSFTTGANDYYSGGNHPCNFEAVTVGPVTIGPIATTGTNHHDIGSNVNFLTSSTATTPTPKLYVFDKAVECIRQLEKKIDQQDELIHVKQEKCNQTELEMNKRLRNERNEWQENYAVLTQRLVHTEQKLNIATENEKRLEEELDQLKIKYKKLKSDYEKNLRDAKNKYGNDRLGQAARRHPIPLGRMQSMPAVHQGGQNYVVKKKLPIAKCDIDDERQIAQRYQNEDQMHRSTVCRRHPIPLRRMQSMPGLPAPAVHQGGQDYVVKKKLPIAKRDIDDERQRAQRHQNEDQMRRSHWSTQAVIGNPEEEDDGDKYLFHQY